MSLNQGGDVLHEGEKQCADRRYGVDLQHTAVGLRFRSELLWGMSPKSARSRDKLSSTRGSTLLIAVVMALRVAEAHHQNLEWLICLHMRQVTKYVKYLPCLGHHSRHIARGTWWTNRMSALKVLTLR